MRILTFDIEDWFHILDNSSTKTESEWLKYESRVERGVDTIFNIIDCAKVSATFFVVGWVAEKYPEIIRKISERGLEIGSHTHLHQLAYEQNRNTFYSDVEKSIKTIEDCTGKKVSSFRAPGFSITKKNKWAFEALYDLGITTDCSVFPASRAHGGLPEYKIAKPSLLKYNGISLKEFPINTHKVLGKHFIFSGGGYFRLLPYKKIKSWTKQSNYVMTYFHPRDFDYKQPMVPGLSPLRKFKSYVGIKGCERKLNQWLKDFEFIDLKTADCMLNWSQVDTVEI